MAPRRPAASNPPVTTQPTPASSVEELNTDTDLPAVLISPIKARAVKKSIVSKTDVEVWHLPDEEIIGGYLFLSVPGSFK